MTSMKKRTFITSHGVIEIDIILEVRHQDKEQP